MSDFSVLLTAAVRMMETRNSMSFCHFCVASFFFLLAVARQPVDVLRPILVFLSSSFSHCIKAISCALHHTEKKDIFAAVMKLHWEVVVVPLEKGRQEVDPGVTHRSQCLSVSHCCSSYELCYTMF